MAVYVKDHIIYWGDAQHKVVKTTWRSPWFGENNVDAYQHDLGIKEYQVIWLEGQWPDGWTVVEETTVNAVHAGMPDYYASTHEIQNVNTIAVRARVAPIIDTDIPECTRTELYGNYIFDPRWPDFTTVELTTATPLNDIENAPNLEWVNEQYKTKAKLKFTGYDPGFDTDLIWFNLQISTDKWGTNGTIYWVSWDRYNNEASINLNDFLPGSGKYKYNAMPFLSDSIDHAPRNMDIHSAHHSPWSNELLARPSAPTGVVITPIPSDDNPNLLKVVISENTEDFNYTDHYEVEYTTNLSYFDTGYGTTVVQSPQHSNVVIIDPGSEGANTYYFRVRVINDTGASEWYRVDSSVSVGTVPDAPTTWTYTNSFVGGDDQYAIFYWTHNAKDGSTQRAANIQVTVNNQSPIYLDWPGVTYSSSSTYKEGNYVSYNGGIYRCKYDITVPEVWTEDHWDYVDDGMVSDDVYTYRLPLTSYGISGVTTIKWAVRTKGVVSTGGPDDTHPGYSKFSTVREIKIYQKPQTDLSITSSTVRSFPISLRCTSTPAAQNPISYTLSMISLDSYDTMGYDGEPMHISAGQTVYKKYGSFPDSQISNPHNFIFKINAYDVHLENGIRYRIDISIGFDSGLTAEDSVSFTTDFSATSILATARIAYNLDNYSAIITPVAYDIGEPFDEHGNPVLADDVMLSVYRKEYNGEMTLIEGEFYNTGVSSIVDPHPSLKTGYYRIIAVDTVTGKISYSDVRGEGLNDPCIIIQWDESYRSLNNSAYTQTPLENPLYEGSFLRLPYNIKASENNSIDVNNVKYIGRKRPVPYFGTQLGETASWNCEFDKKDEETIYQLRRLAIYMGDVYVREPSGMGYWATVKVSFNKDYNSLIIPVTISVTRVEGNGRP